MIIPKKVKVAGLEYKVLTNYKFHQAHDLLGQCDHETQEIRISGKTTANNSRKIDSIEETFIHEMLHAVDRNYNNNALSEEQVTRLSTGIYQTLKDSKMLR